MTNEQLGIEGEKKIRNIVKFINNKLGTNAKMFGPVILNFYSVYGYITCEIDHVLVFDDLIILGETKNGQYIKLDYECPTWYHLNNDITDNPIIQNHFHKEIFCSQFKVQREKVITLEFLLQYKDLNLYTKFPNDYVLGVDKIEDYLTLLINSHGDEIINQEMKSICEKLDIYERAYDNKKVEHLENLALIKRIEEKTRTKDGYYRFKRTDSAKCISCRSYLCFDSGLELKEGNKKRTFEISLKCKNGHEILPKKDTRNGVEYGFYSVEAITLGERMGWNMEEQKETIIDVFEKLKQENQNLKKQILKEKSNYENIINNEKRRIIIEANSVIKEKENIVQKMEERIREAELCKEEANKRAEQEARKVQHFKQIVGPFYYKESKNDK